MAKAALAQQPLPRINILLVEDNPSDAFAVSSLLDGSQSTEYKIQFAGKQAEAVAMLADQSFDVCLLDLTLPDAVNFSALAEIQKTSPDMPILILTGVNDADLSKSAVGRGAQDYLLKDEMKIAGLSRAIDYAMERKRLEKNLFQRANYDTLTGLANRELFMSCLELALARAERSGVGVAVLFIDLDRFKLINDTHGHDAGDEALKTIALRIKNSLRSYDTTARFGGDEFAVLLEGIKNTADAAHIAEKIIKTISAPMPYSHHQLQVGASVGIAFSDLPIAAEKLLQCADIAMYHAKKESGSYRFYSESMQLEAKERLSLEDDLRTALTAEELRLHYQPCIALDSEAMVSVEALLRWEHPDRGLLHAQDFLSAAETGKLMPEIGKWVCSQLRHDIAMWHAHALPPMHITMNLSLSQLDTPSLIEEILPLAQKEFLGNHSLIVEIPEEAVAPISGARFMTLSRLCEMGIGLHLDHFGHRVLPVTTLCSLPFALLKVDMALVQGMSEKASDNVLISAAILLAHHLGMKAGAVGVEIAQQAKTLKAQGCDIIQGHLTARPMPADQLIEWVKNRR